MNLLFNVIYATHTRSTHHKLALHALRELKGAGAQRWQALFLKHHERFLTGAKDPDTKFKDFCNHVLHVEQNNWGGAPKSARKWYEETVAALRQHKWADAVYAAGVLSHYYTDPLMPFHTGQTAEENNIHRATEWSITKSYEQLREIYENDLREVRVRVPKESDWLEQMVIRGAQKSHKHYQELIDHYDIHSGSIDPPSGLDGHSMQFLAELLGYAAVGFARILERAIDEAGVTPPVVQNSVETFLATLEIPIRWVTNKMADSAERRLVEAMYEELIDTGKVEHTLPIDDRTVRAAVAMELEGGSKKSTNRRQLPIETHEPVLDDGEFDDVDDPLDDDPTQESTSPATTPAKQSFASRFSAIPSFFQRKPRSEKVSENEAAPDHSDDEEALHEPAPAAHLHVHDRQEHTDQHEPVDQRAGDESPAPHGLRYYLNSTDPVVDAPSIGPKTAKRLARVGIRTVDDLLSADPAEVADEMNTGWVTADTVIDWQHQALLVCTIPNLRGHDAQILVACGYRAAEHVAQASTDELVEEAVAFCQTTEGQRVIRSGKLPDEQEVGNWIDWAGSGRRADAA